MVHTKFSVLGLEITKDTPTIEEWSAKWGAESVRIEATSNIWYRSTAPEVRDLFLHGQEEQKDDKGNVLVPARQGVDSTTGIPRLEITRTLQSKNTDGTPKTTTVWDPADSEQKYFNRVCATLVQQGKFDTAGADVEARISAARASFQPLLQECATLVEFDAAKAPPTERKAKGITKAFLDAAASAIAKGNAAKLAKFLEKQLGHEVGFTQQELALAMKEDDDKQRAARQQELAALVNG